MDRFKPDMYKKNIYDINYDKLKKNGIKILVFDFDNTIVEAGNHVISDSLKKLFNKLKKDFEVFIISNTLNVAKIDKFANECGVSYVYDARKPSSKGFKQVERLEDVKKDNICMIGDQLITDIWGAKRMGFFCVLVEPINNREWLGTKINRMFEKIIFKRLYKKYKIEKGCYYD